MNWTRFGLVVLTSGIASSMTDWFFMGVLFHEKYKTFPEVWRRPDGGGEGKAIAAATVLGFVTCAIFAYVCVALNLHALHTTLKLALAVWVMASLPITITNYLWIKLHPLGSSRIHSVGWSGLSSRRSRSIYSCKTDRLLPLQTP